ncbi:MAG: hypothetical protein AAF936_10405 [Pseudomonadota bacterium]
MPQLGVAMDTLLSMPAAIRPSGSFEPPPTSAAASSAWASTKAKSERINCSMSGVDCSSMLRENSVIAPTCFGAIETLSNS